METLLFRTTAYDPLVFGGVVFVLADHWLARRACFPRCAPAKPIRSPRYALNDHR